MVSSMTPDSSDHENRWTDVDHALWYLALADALPHRTEGEAELIRQLQLQHPERSVHRVLDIGCGDGRLLALVRAAFPETTGVAIDFNRAMLDRARARFSDEPVDVIEHNLDMSLPELGSFDAVVSSFAIHHLRHDRKRALYREVAAMLGPGGTFANLEHVASPTPRLHDRFRDAVGVGDQPDDPSNILAPVEDQLGWLRAVGLVEVDCLWKWLEMALLIAVRPRD
jgi:tRNA (cmo5U34)-methyltransferase